MSLFLFVEPYSLQLTCRVEKLIGKFVHFYIANYLLFTLALFLFCPLKNTAPLAFLGGLSLNVSLLTFPVLLERHSYPSLTLHGAIRNQVNF